MRGDGGVAIYKRVSWGSVREVREDAMTSSGWRTLSGAEGSRLPHREVTDALLRPPSTEGVAKQPISVLEQILGR